MSAARRSATTSMPESRRQSGAVADLHGQPRSGPVQHRLAVEADHLDGRAVDPRGRQGSRSTAAACRSVTRPSASRERTRPRAAGRRARRHRRARARSSARSSSRIGRERRSARSGARSPPSVSSSARSMPSIDVPLIRPRARIPPPHLVQRPTSAMLRSPGKSYSADDRPCELVADPLRLGRRGRPCRRARPLLPNRRVRPCPPAPTGLSPRPISSGSCASAASCTRCPTSPGIDALARAGELIAYVGYDCTAPLAPCRQPDLDHDAALAAGDRRASRSC